MSDQQDQPKPEQDPIYKAEDQVKNAYQKTKAFVKEHPTLTIGLVGGLVGYRFGHKRGAKALGRDVKVALNNVGHAVSQMELAAVEMTGAVVNSGVASRDEALIQTALNDAHTFIRTTGLRPQFDQYLSDIGRI
jgi:hypothetical protein